MPDPPRLAPPPPLLAPVPVPALPPPSELSLALNAATPPRMKEPWRSFGGSLVATRLLSEVRLGFDLKELPERSNPKRETSPRARGGVENGFDPPDPPDPHDPHDVPPLKREAAGVESPGAGLGVTSFLPELRCGEACGEVEGGGSGWLVLPEREKRARRLSRREGRLSRVKLSSPPSSSLALESLSSSSP